MQACLSRSDHLAGVQAAGGAQHHQIHRFAVGLCCCQQLALSLLNERGWWQHLVFPQLRDQLLRSLQLLGLGVAYRHQLSSLLMRCNGLDVVAADPPAAHQSDADARIGWKGMGWSIKISSLLFAETLEAMATAAMRS